MVQLPGLTYQRDTALARVLNSTTLIKAMDDLTTGSMLLMSQLKLIPNITFNHQL